MADYESYFYGRPTPFYFQALEDSHVLLLDKSCKDYLFEQHAEGQRLQRLIVERNFILFRDRLLSLYLDSPEERYNLLLRHNPTLMQRISQYHIASYVGVKPESLSRLKKWMYQQITKS